VRRNAFNIFAAALVTLAALAVAPAGAVTNGPEQPAPLVGPKVLVDQVGIDQNLGQQLPLDLTFRDDAGKTVKLGDYFKGPSGRPVLMTFVYYECPMLCKLAMGDLVRALNAMPLTAGRDFDIVTVSIDPAETPEQAAKKKRAYLKEHHRAEAERGWHFLTGDQQNIAALTKAAGFRYTWDDKFKQYVHASGLMIASPDGRLTRYFYGVDYRPTDLRLSLVEAADGKVGGVVEQVMLYCMEWNPATSKYTNDVLALLRVAGVITILGIGGMLVFFVRRERSIPVPASTGGPSAPPRDNNHRFNHPDEDANQVGLN
jgi:protein SCO1/2